MSPSASEINRRIRAAQRQAEQQMNREIKSVNDQNRRAAADYNRKVDAQNRRAVAGYNRKVRTQNRKVDAQNRKAVDDINRQLAAADRPRVIYTQQEQGLVERVQEAVPIETRDCDLFLSYAVIDGSTMATELHDELRWLGLAVWFAPIAINPGKSQSLQMDQGLARARAGVAVLTPAYLTGRFWTQRELGALLHKETLIPVLHGVTFADVAEYSGILPDLAGFTTDRDTVSEIAGKIAGALLVPA